MSVTIGSFSASYLKAQPFGFSETNVARGRTARQWEIQGVVLRSAWATLLSTYDAWRALKIAEDDPVLTGVVGATVSFSGTAEGQTWSGIPCWFSGAPAATNAGPRHVIVSCAVVDAAQRLAVLQAEAAEESATDPEFSYGTFSLGGQTITLMEDPYGFDLPPNVSLTDTQNDLIEGAAVVRRTMNIRGWTTDAGAWAAIRTWYEGQALATPTQGSLFPLSLGRMEKDVKTIAGVPTTRFIVSAVLREIVSPMVDC
jgi:hypothetical protein